MDWSPYQAARKGEIDFLLNQSNISEILDQAETIQQKDNLIHIAANFKQTEFAREIVRLSSSLLTRPNSKGDVPLHTAARTGCSAMVVEFISFSTALCCDDMIRKVNLEGDTALHVAIKYGHFEVVDLLVRADIRLLSIRNKHCESPLYLAVEGGFFEIVENILRVCPTCSYRGTKGMTAMHAAVVRSHQGFEYVSPLSVLSLVRLLWSSTSQLCSHFIGCFLGNTSHRDNTERRETVAPELLSSEGSLEVVINLFFKLLNCLPGNVSDRTDEIMKLLLEKRPDMVTETDIFKRTPLHYAAHLGHLEATRKLLECDKSVGYLRDEEDSSALHIAAKKGYINIIEEITKNCPCAYQLVDNKGRTILHVAAIFGKSKLVDHILKVQEWEILINEKDYQGNTALHLAAIYGHYVSVWTLAGDHRVDKRATNNEYLKAIDIVQSDIDVGEVIKYLIMKKLENGGARQSLDRLFFGENTDRKNNGNEEPKQDINKLDQLKEDGPRISVNASESLRDRNNEVVNNKEISSKHLKDVSKTHLLVATLVAAVTYAASFSLAGGGGYNEDDPNKGKTVLSTKEAFKSFVLTNAIAFYCSSAAVLFHFFASLKQSYHILLRFIKFAALLTYISIVAMVVAFTSGDYVVLPDSSPIPSTLIVVGSSVLIFNMHGFYKTPYREMIMNVYS